MRPWVRATDADSVQSNFQALKMLFSPLGSGGEAASGESRENMTRATAGATRAWVPFIDA